MLDTYRLRMAAMGSYDGEARRRNSQKIMDTSWMRDPATKPVYVKWVDSGLPVVDDDDIPVYAKFNVKSYHNITGDEIAYLLQFRIEDIKAIPDIKVGAYVQICNEIDEPEWWLIVHYDDRIQFRQFSILKCTWIYKWISNVSGKRIIYQCLGAPRKQNSYNSGVWLDYYAQVVENQDVFWVPTNDDTKTLLYDTRIMKSEVGRYPPIVYKISKVEDTATRGITKFTMTQEQFDSARDNVELMICNYHEHTVQPEFLEAEEIPTINDLEISYSGKPCIRAGGGFKKLTLKERVDGKLIDIAGDVKWSVDFSNGDSTKLEHSASGNIFKIKCLPEYSLIGKTFTVTATTKHSSASLIVEVIGL